MIELGRVQELMVVREKNFGVYLGQKKDDAAAVLLPKKQVPEGTKVGDKLKVFIYKDSEDRLIATTSMPKLELGGTAVLKVKDVSKIGAFLDMGLEKDLLLPFKEQVYPVHAVIAFQLLNGAGHGGLRHVQLLRRARDASAAVNCQKDPHVPNCHAALLHS